MSDTKGFFRCYEPKNFNAEQLALIGASNKIIERYEAQGYSMSVRQIYYQLVTVNAIENKPTSYDRLSALLSDARLAGLVSWTSIEDRLRQLRGETYYEDPNARLTAALEDYKLDKWIDQPCRVEVMVEKDALSDVVGVICEKLGIDYTILRGYASTSSLWRAGRRYMQYITKGQRPIVLHLGDHDPSGLDMTRDNERRISMFAGTPIQFIRIALNWEQIELYQPPPNPAKISDSRYGEYAKQYGEESYELDALTPEVLHDLISQTVLAFRDEKKWDAMLKQEVEDKRYIEALIESQDGNEYHGEQAED